MCGSLSSSSPPRAFTAAHLSLSFNSSRPGAGPLLWEGCRCGGVFSFRPTPFEPFLSQAEGWTLPLSLHPFTPSSCLGSQEPYNRCSGILCANKPWAFRPLTSVLCGQPAHFSSLRLLWMGPHTVPSTEVDASFLQVALLKPQSVALGERAAKRKGGLPGHSQLFLNVLCSHPPSLPSLSPFQNLQETGQS